jgi:sec-independent protein translocase protein TatC
MIAEALLIAAGSYLLCGLVFAIPFVLMSTIFFVAGGLFAHYVAFPVTWVFFNSFSTDYMVFMPKIDEAFSLYTKMLLGSGLIFEMPTLVLFLARMGVVSGRLLLKYFKYAFLAIFIIAAVISPGTDMMSQLVMAVPMLALYIISIAIAFIFQKRRKPATD